MCVVQAALHPVKYSVAVKILGVDVIAPRVLTEQSTANVHGMEEGALWFFSLNDKMPWAILIRSILFLPAWSFTLHRPWLAPNTGLEELELVC